MGQGTSGVRSQALLRVPLIAASFWVAKGLSTALGESTSDYLVHALSPPVAVLLGCVAFISAIAWQFSQRRYVAVPYWLAVVMVGIFGTMAADVLHVGFGVPYALSTVFFAAVLAGVFLVWFRTEQTLSIHTIDTQRRELFYWAAVVATFALGTGVGDLTAITFGLGYAGSIALFAVLLLVPCIGYRYLRWNPIAAFWVAYVLTRPLGASVADWMGKPTSDGGLGWGSGPVSIGLAVAIAVLVAWLAVTRRDVQELAVANGGDERHHRHGEAQHG
jgi:uncharacterized membrane-anchored protein